MANPDPIKYSDLISYDDSIEKLISELNEVISVYDKLKKDVMASASEAAKAMQGLSGATDEQRQAIAQNAQRAEELSQKYRRLTEEEVQLKAAQQDIVAANREAVKMARLQKEAADAAEGSYKRLSAQYRINKEQLNKMTLAEREGNEAGRKLETETRKIYEEMSRLQKATGKYTLEVGHYENALRGLPGPIGQVVGSINSLRTSLNNIGGSEMPSAQKGGAALATTIGGIVAITAVLGHALAGAGKVMRDFEQANANLATILGVNNSEMTTLSSAARQLAKDTQYSATGVTELQTELAKLGFTQDQIISMQSSVAQFATAVGTDLASAARIAGASLNALGKSASDTDEVLGVMAVTTNKTALTVDGFQNAIGKVFVTANQFGYSLEDVSALLGTLVNNGMEASMAASTLNRIILKLSDSDGKLAKTLGGTVNTFDGLIDGMITLRDKGISLNEVLELTDNRSALAFSTFLDGAEKARELRDSLSDVSGVLDEIATQRLSTTQGAIEQLNSAWENLILSFDKGNNVFGSLAIFATDFINAITPKTEFDKAKEEIDALFERYGDDAEGAAKEVDRQLVWMTIKMDQFASYQAKETFWDKIFGRDPNAESKRIAAQIQEQIDSWVSLANAELQRRKAQYSWTIFDGAPDGGTGGGTSGGATSGAGDGTTQNKGGGGRQAWSLQNDKTFQAKRLELLKEYSNGEIATREEYDKALSELEINTLQSRMNRLKEGSSERIKLETQITEKTIALRQKEAKAAEDADAAAVKAGIDYLNKQKETLQLEIAGTVEGTSEMLALRLELIEKEREIELKLNREKAEEMRQDEALINAKYDRMRLDEVEENAKKMADAAKKGASNGDSKSKGGKEKAQDLFDVFGIHLGGKNEDKSVLDERKEALTGAIDTVKESVSSLIDTWREEAHAAVEAADAQVDSAQKVLDAEREAAAQGYAANVARAQAELELAKKNREDALKEEQKAQKAQLAIDSITQASSLVTASANIWSSLSGIPMVGPALAVAALALMWGSFAASKIKAAQVAKETYGEGTVELLKGGSHASGNDIYLGMTDDGKERRAEGGEYFAVINKRNSRKFGAVIPDVINSFNDGTFADKYMRSGEAMKGYAVQMMVGADLAKVEDGIEAIRKQGEESRTSEGGYTVIRYKNLTRRVKS